MNDEIYDFEKRANNDVIKNMVDNGTDIEKIHQLEHIFFGNKDSLSKIKKKLLNMNFQEIELTDSKLVMCNSQTLDLENVTKLTCQLVNLSSQLGIDYDGWGAVIVK
jgi:regulator of RNase E activity RraB